MIKRKMSEECSSAINELKRLSDPANVAGMARYGISTLGTLGVSMPAIRSLAKRIGRNHQLGLELWDSGYHEARILAALVADPRRTDRALMESWAQDFDSWDVCDQVCNSLFSKVSQAYEVIPDWTAREEEFVRRAGFVMMAALAVHDKKADDRSFLSFLSLIEERADDDRNYVKKAVNWALRQIGKRGSMLREECIACAERLRSRDAPRSKWIASDALRELRSEAVVRRIAARGARSRSKG
jgi:3-methyladenine DNA glycosylase AlkD